MKQETIGELEAERLRKMPIIETKMRVSEDRKWVIHSTTITDIKPVTYVQKVLEEVR